MSQSSRGAVVPLDSSRQTVWSILVLCGIALVALAYVVDSGQAFIWWDYAGGHMAEQAANSYNDLTPYTIFSALGMSGDWRVTVLIALVSMLVLAWRRSGWFTLLPLLLILTILIEYLTKQSVYQPWPTPEVVSQPSL